MVREEGSAKSKFFKKENEKEIYERIESEILGFRKDDCLDLLRLWSI